MIKVQNLKVGLGDRDIIKGIDFNVEKGETLAIMGASGSGKSTILRCVSGLIPPDEGDIWLFGEQLVGTTAAKLRKTRHRIGMLFQQNALFDSMTVEDNMGFVLKEVKGFSPKQIRQRVDELLERLHLGPIGKKWPSELSGGMKKRVGIARAVAHDPEMIFYDDPTAGLDPVTSDVISELIKELGENKNNTAIIVSNYLPLIMKAAQKAALLYKGKIIDLGDPAKLKDSQPPELKKFLESE
jgi:phospholipid/cholesterol/gamma-HCH transport system ATP-binding protein